MIGDMSDGRSNSSRLDTVDTSSNVSSNGYFIEFHRQNQIEKNTTKRKLIENTFVEWIFGRKNL